MAQIEESHPWVYVVCGFPWSNGCLNDLVIYFLVVDVFLFFEVGNRGFVLLCISLVLKVLLVCLLMVWDHWKVVSKLSSFEIPLQSC